MPLDNWESAKHEYAIDARNASEFRERTDARLRSLERRVNPKKSQADAMRDHIRRLIAEKFASRD